MTQGLVELRGIEKQYPVGSQILQVLHNIDLSLFHGEFLAIAGPSGSGKSTLLNIVGCLERPTKGEYTFDGKNAGFADDRALSRLRAASLGFVFQTFNLVPTLNLLENVALPFLYSRTNSRHARQKALAAIEEVGLSHRIHHRPAELSGGEMQRTAIARAIATAPKLILADEPTGNLDSTTGGRILELLKALNRRGTSIMMVTHDPQVAALASRRCCIQDGALLPGGLCAPGA